MSGDLLNLQFGSYNGMVSEFKRNYDFKANDNKESAFTIYEKGTKKVAGNGYRENITYSEYSQPQYADAIIFKGKYTYGTSAKNEEGLDKFDFIIGKNEYAIDINGNGKVDSDEIFSGKFDRYSYRKAKEEGDLKKYKQIYEQYKYNWLK